jgi:hypothetical protein
MVEDDVDDDVRSTLQSQNQVTATLRIEEPFPELSIYSSPLILVWWGGGQEIDGQHDTIVGWGWISCPSQTHLQSNRVYNYFVTGEDK